MQHTENLPHAKQTEINTIMSLLLYKFRENSNAIQAHYTITFYLPVRTLLPGTSHFKEFTNFQSVSFLFLAQNFKINLSASHREDKKGCWATAALVFDPSKHHPGTRRALAGHWHRTMLHGKTPQGLLSLTLPHLEGPAP